MSETTEVDDQLVEDQPAELDQHADDEQHDVVDEPASNEAKRYRLQLRDTEQKLEQLALRVETMQRGEVERIAGRTVQKPSSLWAAGVQVADMLDTEGNVDPEMVKAATVKAAEELGLTRPHPGNIVPSEGANPRRDHIPDDMESIISGGA